METPKEKPKKLSTKQKQFCLEYLNDFNGTQAAIRTGYSERTARTQAAKMLTKGNIQNFISLLKGKRNNKLQISQEEMLTELVKYAESDITDTLGLDVQGLKDLPIEIRRMIGSYKLTRQKIGDIVIETIELKFIDKVKIIDMINKHIGLYDADNKQKSDVIVVKPQRND